MFARSRLKALAFAALCAFSVSTAYADALKINTPIFPAFTVGQSSPSTAAFASTGGQGNNTYAVTAGTLPSGVALDPSSGTLTGTPSATGVSVIRVRVKDKSGASASSGPVRIAVNTGVLITIPNLGTVTPGASFQSSSAVVSGGRAPYQISLFSGSLPPNFSMSSTTGVITGSSKTVGTYSFRIQAVDADGRVGISGTLTITIANPTKKTDPTVTTPTTPTIPTPTDAKCGPADGQSYAGAPPTSGFCSSGTASGLSFSTATALPSGVECGFAATGTFLWTCSSTDGGASARCGAYALDFEPAVCGMDNGLHLTSRAPMYLCAYGTPSSVSGSGPYSWTCTSPYSFVNYPATISCGTN